MVDYEDEYKCEVVWRDGGYSGRVSVRGRWKAKGWSAGGITDYYWQYGESRLLYDGPPVADPGVAGAAATQWCLSQGITDYASPVLSGMGSSWVIRES